jgi:hypothetical protein
MTGAVREMEFEADAVFQRGDGLRAVVPLSQPIAIPDAAIFEAHARDSRTRAVETLEVAELAPIDIGQRQMRQIEIVNSPDRGIANRFAMLALAEEDQFETVMSSARTLPV